MKHLEITCVESDTDYLELEDNLSPEGKQALLTLGVVTRRGMEAKSCHTLDKDGALKVIEFLNDFFNLPEEG